MEEVELIATKDFQRGELIVKEGGKFKVDPTTADFLIHISKVAKHAPKPKAG